MGNTIQLSILTDPNYIKAIGFKDDKDFLVTINSLISNNFPNIKLRLRTNKIDVKMLFEMDKEPDIVLDYGGELIPGKYRIKFPLSLDDYLVKYKINLNEFDKSLFVCNDNQDELRYFPFSRFIYAFYYNKSMFLKHGIPNPVSSMSWEDVILLAKSFPIETMSSMMINPGHFPRLVYQFGCTFIDPTTGTPNTITRDWIDLTLKLKDIFQIKGNIPEQKEKMLSFGGDKDSLMFSAIGHQVFELEKNSEIEIDMVSLPTFKPYIGMPSNPLFFSINSKSKHSEEAFQVMFYLLSNDVQQVLFKKGIPTPLLSIDKQTFGSNNERLRFKNKNAFFVNDFYNIEVCKEEALIQSRIWELSTKKMINLIVENMDPIIGLRELQEELNILCRRFLPNFNGGK